MGRSRWKLQYFSKSVWRKIANLIFLKNIKIFKYKIKKSVFYDRSSCIPLCFKNIFFRIYKGKNIRRLYVSKYNVGRKFGEFAFTRKPFHFPLKKKKNKKLIRR